MQSAGERGPSLAQESEIAEPVEVATGDGAFLRGAYIEPCEDGFLVLHLLASRVSVATGIPIGFGRIGLDGTTEQLRALGHGSLALDYRGVGDSTGPRQTHRLLDDGWLMWNEALRRVNGDASRIVIRAGSIGSLIAVDLLERGAQPGGVILYAPVRAATIVKHAANVRRGGFVAWYARWAIDAPSAPELNDVLRQSSVPMLVVVPERDIYLPPDEQAQVLNSAQQGGHEFVIEKPSHTALILRSWGYRVDVEDDENGNRSFTGGVEPELFDAERAYLEAMAERRRD